MSRMRLGAGSRARVISGVRRSYSYSYSNSSLKTNRMAPTLPIDPISRPLWIIWRRFGERRQFPLTMVAGYGAAQLTDRSPLRLNVKAAPNESFPCSAVPCESVREVCFVRGYAFWIV